MAKIIPIDGRVVLKGVAAEETTKSGIILPKSEERPEIYQVIAISEGKRLKDGSFRKHLVKVGQKVICSKYAGDDVKIENEEVKIIAEDSISAIVQD
ncbi:MAG: co-chaperone GroES [bacterium]|nr:co-chaperone GroES [bacterium]